MRCDIVKIKKVFVISLLANLMLVVSSKFINAQAQNNLQGYQTFEEWCINQESLTVEKRQTVEILLEVAETEECDRAQSILKQVEDLTLKNRQITDLSPFASLMNLEKLNLSDNQITDISPLATLNKLSDLDLGSNTITDLSPLSNLNNLKKLDLYGNQIIDISPLNNMNNLRRLCINDDRIANRNCPYDTPPLVNPENFNTPEPS